MNMGGMIMTVRAHDARSAMYRMIRPAPDGRRRAKDPGPAAPAGYRRSQAMRGIASVMSADDQADHAHVHELLR